METSQLVFSFQKKRMESQEFISLPGEFLRLPDSDGRQTSYFRSITFFDLYDIMI